MTRTKRAIAVFTALGFTNVVHVLAAFMSSSSLCKAAGCTKPDPGNRKGYCYAHYLRLWRHGDANAGGYSRGQARRFIDDHVNFQGDQCLQWPFFRNNGGYGDIQHPTIEGLAHRVMCVLAHGWPVDNNDEAAHLCGKGHEGCVNPRHLAWKSRIDNIHDKVDHGTQPWGQDVHFAKLTLEQAKRVKYGNEPGTTMAKELNVSTQTIYNIRANRTWKGI